MEHLRYPVGQFAYGTMATAEERPGMIAEIKSLPEKLDLLLGQLSAEQMSKPYRPGGWNGYQVVHHLADSHANAMIRTKLALTEEFPQVKPYHEDRWAALADSSTTDLKASLGIIHGVHHRWTMLWENMSDADFERGYFHPEHKRVQPLSEVLALYDWHCRHHLGHLGLLL